MKYLLIISLLFGVRLAFSQEFVFKYEGDKRKYIVHLPKEYSPSKKYPLVLSFHGIIANNKQQRKYSQMDKTADRHGFIVVYPQGKGHFWNTGIGKKSYRNGRNDVGFVNEVINRLVKDFSIDTTRVYACGLSLGGYFSYRLACELSPRIVAIASVGGVTSDSTAKYSTGSRPVPVLQIHGTSDRIVKYGGIKQSLSVEQTVNFWIKKNHCVSSDTTMLPEVCAKDKTKAQLIQFKSERPEQVWFIKVLDGGHTWPGAKIDYLFLGKTNLDFDASEMIWKFFTNYHL